MKTRLLYVEDDAINALVLHKLLHKEHDITLAHDQNEALEILASNVFDLLILDYNLNGELNGQQLLQKIRSTFPNKYIPAIALTADSSLQKELTESDFEAYMTKPFQKEALLRCIDDCLPATQD